MRQLGARKQRTHIMLTCANLAAARELGLNVSAISDAARLARAKAWTWEHAAAIAERHVWMEANGAPLADLQVLKID